MSRPQVQRPGTRPGAAAPATTTSKGPSVEQLRELPAFSDEGVEATFDPSQASSGRMQDELALIVGAKFATQNWQKKDGTFATRKDGSACWPEVQMQISYRREGDGADDRPYTESYRYGSPGYFVPSKDGNTVRVRAGIVKDGGFVPTPKKMEAAMLFLQSLKDADKTNSIIGRMKTEGAKALVGLYVHVRSRKVAGQNEKAPPVLLIDSIQDGSPAPVNQAAVKTASTAMAPAVSVSSETDNLAVAALLDILGAAEGNTIARAQIPTTLIRLDKWKAHEHRGAILKTLRDDAFINHSDRLDVLWTLDGANLSKL